MTTKATAQHTPGWHAAIDVHGSDSQIVDHGGLVATVYSDPKTLRSGPRATLIAAAPDLLAALEAIVGIKGACDLDDVNTGYNATVRDIARAAIRKARGK